jgi:hypothetical protein
MDHDSDKDAEARQVALRHAARDLYLAFHHSADHFTAQLFRLMHKADAQNFELLKRGFPVACDAYRLWREAPTEKRFFEYFNVGEILHGPEKAAYNRQFKG